jgi:hypothetical protein
VGISCFGAVELLLAAMGGDRVLGSMDAEFLLRNFGAPTVMLFLLTGCARTHAFLVAFMYENKPYRGGSWLSWLCAPLACWCRLVCGQIYAPDARTMDRLIVKFKDAMRLFPPRKNASKFGQFFLHL